MKKTLFTGFVAVGIGLISSLTLVGAIDPEGVLFVKRVDTITDGTTIGSGENTVLEFDVTNGYTSDAKISSLDFSMRGSSTLDFVEAPTQPNFAATAAEAAIYRFTVTNNSDEISLLEDVVVNISASTSDVASEGVEVFNLVRYEDSTYSGTRTDVLSGVSVMEPTVGAFNEKVIFSGLSEAVDQTKYYEVRIQGGYNNGAASNDFIGGAYKGTYTREGAAIVKDDFFVKASTQPTFTATAAEAGIYRFTVMNNSEGTTWLEEVAVNISASAADVLSEGTEMFELVRYAGAAYSGTPEELSTVTVIESTVGAFSENVIFPSLSDPIDEMGYYEVRIQGGYNNGTASNDFIGGAYKGTYTSAGGSIIGIKTSNNANSIIGDVLIDYGKAISVSTEGSISREAGYKIVNFVYGLSDFILGAGETQRVTVDFDLPEGDIETEMQFAVNEIKLESGSGVYLSTDINSSLLGREDGAGETLDGAIFNVSLEVSVEDSGEGEEEELESGSGSVLKVESDFISTKTIKEDMILTLGGSDQFNFAALTTLETPDADAIAGETDGLSVHIPAGTTFTGSGSGLWDGTFDAPKRLGLPLSHDLPENHNPQKRISVGAPMVGINLSFPVTITIPVEMAGTGYIYSSQNGSEWTYEKTCAIAGGFCIFQTTHFTEFLVASLDTSDTNNGAKYIGHSSGGGQNTMRHGSYDPNNRAAKKTEAQSEIKTTIFRRSAKSIRNYIPCEINEGAEMANRFYNLKLSQGAPSVCREDVGSIFGVPYKVGK